MIMNPARYIAFGLILDPFHRCISEYPSANDNPAAPLWKGGRTRHLTPSGRITMLASAGHFPNLVAIPDIFCNGLFAIVFVGSQLFFEEV